MPQAIQCINDLSSPCLYNVTIILTTVDHRANFWDSRLSQGVFSGRKSNDGSLSVFPMLLSVSEGWVNLSSAGNDLEGTMINATSIIFERNIGQS